MTTALSPCHLVILSRSVSFPPCHSVHDHERLTRGDRELGGNTTFVGVDSRARLMGKTLTISALVLLLSVLYLVLTEVLAPRFDLPGAPIGHLLVTVLIAILV